MMRQLYFLDQRARKGFTNPRFLRMWKKSPDRTRRNSTMADFMLEVMRAILRKPRDSPFDTWQAKFSL